MEREQRSVKRDFVYLCECVIRLLTCSLYPSEESVPLESILSLAADEIPVLLMCCNKSGWMRRRGWTPLERVYLFCGVSERVSPLVLLAVMWSLCIQPWARPVLKPQQHEILFLKWICSFTRLSVHSFMHVLCNVMCRL